MQIKPPNKLEFAESVVRRQASTANRTLEELTSILVDYYSTLDGVPRRKFIDQAVQMYANYENRWMGEVRNGQWVDATPQGTNNVYFTVPLLTAHVDTHTTFYTKTRPKYIARPFINTQLNRRLAEMCQTIGNAELARMMSYSKLQHEAQNIALATVSYRNIVMDYLPHSPVITKTVEESSTVEVEQYRCADCGEQFTSDEPSQCPNPECMSANVEDLGPTEQEQTVEKEVSERLPRPKIEIPNPISVQDDFSAASFNDSRFIITRRKISRKEAEFYYQIDLSSAYDNSGAESNAQHTLARIPVGPQQDGSNWIPLEFPKYVDIQNEQVEEVKFWLSPCEYGLYFVDGELLQTKYPSGLMLHVVGDRLVSARPCDKNVEWVRVQQGVRPVSNKGMGMQHLADLNDAVNNAMSLEYSILRTHGFPIRLLRSKWISQLPQANQTLLVERIPDERQLSEAMHTEQASNTSGLLGVITQKFMGLMQYIGGSLNPVGLPADAKDYMGSATAAASFQEMMSDRMGLSIQMRVEADIDTIFAVLTLLKQDKRNAELFMEEYDESVVAQFFKADFRSLFYMEPVRGTDEPKLDSVNTFKVQSFAQLTGALTGLRQFDEDTFYDIIATLGETLNIDVSIGAGRSERNLAENRISRVIELYKVEKELPDVIEMDPITFGTRLFQAVTMKEKLWMEAIIRSQLPKPPTKQDIDGLNAEQLASMAMAMEEQAAAIAESIEINLYNYNAMADSYSDWLQSEAGQNADIAITIAIGMLYAYCREQIERKQAKEAAAQEEMMLKAALMGQAGKVPPKEEESRKGDRPDNPPGPAKRDGSSGPGRPREPKVDKPPDD